jgi:hypothetical protein
MTPARGGGCAAGELDPITGHVYGGPQLDAQLRRGDLLLVDEAGMLDQDTARAVLTIADETGARVGPGRVTGVSCRRSAAAGCSTWPTAGSTRPPGSTSTRCTGSCTAWTARTVPDAEYAQLSLAMRAGEDPGAVFDALHARGQIALYGSETERRDALAGRVAAARLSGLTPRWWSTPATTPPRSTPRSATGSSPPAPSTTTVPR